MYQLKVFYQQCVKKFIFPETYDLLLDIVTSSFNITKENAIFNFIDEDGDKIVISSDFDYNHVIQLLKRTNTNTLKLNLNTSPDHSKAESFNISNSIINDKHIEELNIDNEIKIKLKANIKREIDLYVNQLRNNLNQAIENKISLLLSKDNKKTDEMICIYCKTRLNESNILKCFICNDFLICKNCENCEETQNHILIKYKNPDIIHLEALKNKSELNILNKNNFSFKNIIAFNTIQDKYIIDVNNSDVNNYLTYNFSLINMTKFDILIGDSLECLFDESDVFGNKYIFNEHISSNSQFSIEILFYNFTNKHVGYYTSKWVFNLQSNKGNKYNLNFIFYLRPERGEEFSFKGIRKESTNSEKSISNTKSFPDLYSEIIKKHQDKEK